MLTAAIRQKTADLEKLRVRMGAMLEEYPKGLPTEKAGEWSAMLQKAGELKGEIDSETKLENDKQSLADIDRYLNDPVRNNAHGHINNDDDGRKALRAQGWEIKGGMVYAPHSQEGQTFARIDGTKTVLGKQEMFPEEVLFGDIPENDPIAAHYFKQVRASMQPSYKTAYTRYMRFAVQHRSEGMAFNMLAPSEQKALSEGADANGGFLVPPDTQGEVLARVAQMAIFRQFARVQTTSRDYITWPMVKAHASSGSIYSSGFVGGWAGETPAFTDTDPGFQQFAVPIKKIRVATKLSNDLVADAAVNILSWLAMNGSENMALVEDSGFLTGDGTALQPLGILNTSGITTVDVEGSTSNTISNTTSAAGTAPKLITLAYALPSQYLNRSRWFMRRTIEGKIRGLVDAQGRFMWPAATEGSFAQVARTLMGYPVENSDFMPNDGADANKVLLYGDLSYYIIGQRAQITSVVLRERFADTDQVGIILFERVGGACWNPDAFRIGIV